MGPNQPTRGPECSPLVGFPPLPLLLGEVLYEVPTIRGYLHPLCPAYAQGTVQSHGLTWHPGSGVQPMLSSPGLRK